MDKIIAYCDGSCRGNGKANNVGGWGVVLKCGDKIKTLKGKEFGTTNNRMEIMSCIVALDTLKGAGFTSDTKVEVYTDSNLVFNACNGWLNVWVRDNWVKKVSKQPVANVDLWKILVSLNNYFKCVSYNKVKGHSDDELNILADKLATDKKIKFLM